MLFTAGAMMLHGLTSYLRNKYFQLFIKFHHRAVKPFQMRYKPKPFSKFNKSPMTRFHSTNFKFSALAGLLAKAVPTFDSQTACGHSSSTDEISWEHQKMKMTLYLLCMLLQSIASTT
jgi:hypothetical protein